MESQEWVVDSGATHHYWQFCIAAWIYTMNWAKSLTPTVKSYVTQITGQRIVCMESPEGTTVWLDNVRYVPRLTENLFSVASEITQLLTNGKSSGFVSTVWCLSHNKVLCDPGRYREQVLCQSKFYVSPRTYLTSSSQKVVPSVDSMQTIPCQLFCFTSDLTLNTGYASLYWT